MIDVIKQFEAVPAAYPNAPAGLSTKAAALDASMIWARIEAYTAYRFTVRELVWTLRGDGGDEFHPRLTPVVSRVADIWANEAWEAVTLQDGPFGICLPVDGVYRITAQVGAGDVPAPIYQAFQRLAMAQKYCETFGRRDLADSAFSKLDGTNAEQKLANHPARFATFSSKQRKTKENK